MHEIGYSFNGDANISGLTKREADALVLGRLMENEHRKEEMPGTMSPQRERRRQNLMDEVANAD